MDKFKETIAQVFEEIADGLETGSFGKKTRIGLTILGSELGIQEVIQGGEEAQRQDPALEVVIIGDGGDTDLERIPAANEKEAHEKMDEMLTSGSLDGAVTMHYNFPIGVATVGRVFTPAKGKKMYLATTTGTSAIERAAGMIRNTLYGIATAKACGQLNPTVGILNIDGARQVERALIKLKENGYPLNLTQSRRADGGVLMRGNDLLTGEPDVMVQDSLTGNVLMKMFSAYTTGGGFEALGDGYGPGVGEDYDRIICIISRASGGSVIAGAIQYAASLAEGKLPEKIKDEFAMAKKAGLDDLLKSCQVTSSSKNEKADQAVVMPAKKLVTDDIPGVEVLELEDAVEALWQAGIYAESGMGCTGPIVMVNEKDRAPAEEILKKKGFL